MRVLVKKMSSKLVCIRVRDSEWKKCVCESASVWEWEMAWNACVCICVRMWIHARAQASAYVWVSVCACEIEKEREVHDMNLSFQCHPLFLMITQIFRLCKNCFIASRKFVDNKLFNDSSRINFRNKKATTWQRQNFFAAATNKKHLSTHFSYIHYVVRTYRRQLSNLSMNILTENEK